jgi:hypothetical protein
MNTNDPKSNPDPLPRSENSPSFPAPPFSGNNNNQTSSDARAEKPLLKEKLTDSQKSSQGNSDSFEEKVRDNLRDARDSRNDDLYDYTNYTREQIITYVLLILGLLLLFVNPFIGGLIIGVVAGYYFTDNIVSYLRNIGRVLSGQDHLRYITLTGLLLGLFITAPGIFIGAAIAAAFRQIVEAKPVE